MSFFILSFSILVTAIIHIRAEYTGPRSVVHIFKPLTTCLIILMALLVVPVTPFYKWMIVIGLIFSLFGDIFLMFPEKRFVPGLVSFLIAHLFYIAGFIHQSQSIWYWPSAIPFILYGIVIVSVLYPGLGKLKGPVLAYVLVILAMGWQAVNHWLDQPDQLRLMAAVGAVIFMISDSLIALDKFKEPFKRSRMYIMTTYYFSQWLIALSIGS